MKVELHDFQQQKWFLDLEPTETIGNLKALNAVERNYDATITQKLFFSGKILKDEDTLGSLDYVEGKSFIVCMASKARKRPAAQKAPVKIDEAKIEPEKESSEMLKSDGTKSDFPETQKADEVASTSNETGKESEKTPEKVPEKAPEKSADTNTLVKSIVELGFKPEVVREALQATNNNPDLAITLLTNSDLSIPGTNESGSAEGAVGNTIDQNLFDAAKSDDEDSEIDFQEFLGLSDEDVHELREETQKHPNGVMHIIEPMIHHNPEMAYFLIRNLKAFADFMMDPRELPDIPGSDEMMAEDIPIEISPEEDEAISRLAELGFDKDVVVMAYFACDKDEQLAANYLLEHGDEA